MRKGKAEAASELATKIGILVAKYTAKMSSKTLIIKIQKNSGVRSDQPWVIALFWMGDNAKPEKAAQVEVSAYAPSCRRCVATYWKEQTRRSQNCKYLS